MFMARRVAHAFLYVTVGLSATMVLLVPAAVGSGSAKYTVTAVDFRFKTCQLALLQEHTRSRS